MAFARPRPPLPPAPEPVLKLWRFDADLFIDPLRAPLAVNNVDSVESWSGYALRLAGRNSARVIFPALDPMGNLNLSPKSGTIRVWFSPYWTSAGLGGQGPGHPARLLEVGAWSDQGAAGQWSLAVSPDGGSVSLVSSGAAAEQAPVLTSPLAWRAGSWHQVALSYSLDSSALYLDGSLAAVGPGITLWSTVAGRELGGFALGSDALGGHLAQGEFDELATFGERQSDRDIAANYAMLKDRAALGPLTDAEEAQYQAMKEAAIKNAAALLAEQGPTGPMSLLSCPSLRLLIDRQPNGTLELSICGGREGALYDLFSIGDVSLAPFWQFWAFTAQMEPDDTVTVAPGTETQFYKLAEVLDLDNLGPISFYVAPYAVPGADGSRDLPFPSLQDALNSPSVIDGSVIQVLPGVYRGPTNRNLSFGGRDLVLVSQRGAESTSIDCENTAGSRAFILDSPGPQNRSLVAGFSISNAANSAVYCSSGTQPYFVNCLFAFNVAGSGAGLHCDNAKPTLVNCRFFTNSAATQGGAIYATGPGALVRVTHCTFADNPRPADSGTLALANAALMDLNNTIVWSVMANSGAEIVLNTGAGASATYCNVRGGFPGGNLNTDPLFELGNLLRLTTNSPCIDQGTVDTFPGCRGLIGFDMDGEARLDHALFGNPVSSVDIGADEFVYRIQFPLVSQTVYVPDLNGGFIAETRLLSEVDEASGVAYLGANAMGPIIGIVDDEDRANFRIYQLNGDATAVIQSAPISTLNTLYPSQGDQEIADMEGLTFDSANRVLYLITSQTKRNRYRDVDSSPPILDPVVDPPSNDYDRRRAVLIQVQLDASLTAATGTSFFESENQPVPFNAGYDATAGLAAFLRQQFQGNAALGSVTIGNRVLIARNTVNKFGTPINGEQYNADDPLPYSAGGPSATAGTSLGLFDPGGPAGGYTNTTVTAGQVYYYKIWASDANFNYYPGPVAVANNNGIPVV